MVLQSFRFGSNTKRIFLSNLPVNQFPLAKLPSKGVFRWRAHWKYTASMKGLFPSFKRRLNIWLHTQRSQQQGTLPHLRWSPDERWQSTPSRSCDHKSPAEVTDMDSNHLLNISSKLFSICKYLQSSSLSTLFWVHYLLLAHPLQLQAGQQTPT